MLKILEGKKIIETEDLSAIGKRFDKVVVDVGTGNGKYVYDLALANPETLYIGIEPAADNLLEYAKKAMKNIARKGAGNLIYLISSVEALEGSLEAVADEVYVNFPWGSLLEGVVKGEEEILSKLAMLAKGDAALHLTFSYSSIHEPAEIIRRGLPELNEDYIGGVLKRRYEDCGLDIESFRLMEGGELKGYGTFWAKRLFLGKSRDVYALECRRIRQERQDR